MVCKADTFVSFYCMDEELQNFLLLGRYRLAVTLHDYYVVCPRVNMTNSDIYCHEAGEEKCNLCMHDALAESPMDFTGHI